MSKAYSSNLSLEQWELIKPLIPPAKSGGRPREVEVWNILNAIFYLLTQGCTWRNLPGDFPAWQTVYRYFRTWRKDGTWLTLHDRLRVWVRVAHDRAISPSEAIIDSQSVKSAAMVNQAVGYDAGKQIKGRKRFLSVDTLGLLLRVYVMAASTGEREGGKRVHRMGKAVSRLHTIWTDGGFDGEPFMQWVINVCRWIVQVVLRPEQTKGFVLLKKRWVERAYLRLVDGLPSIGERLRTIASNLRSADLSCNDSDYGSAISVEFEPLSRQVQLNVK